MQIPLGAALSAAAMKPSATSVASTVLSSAAFTAANSVGMCLSLAYADGGIYCRKYEERGGCVSDLGDFPAKKSFRLNFLWSDDMRIYLLEQTKGHNYIQYSDHLYLDASPGAFEPLSFTADNSTLADGETSWAWTGVMGFPLWTPTGDPRDASPGSAVKGQGFDWVEVEGYPGLQRAYWNQTLYEEVWEGRDEGHMLTMCRGDLHPVLERGGSASS